MPFVATRVLDEVLITLSLCILLYEKGSRSAFPRTKHLMNTLVIYAVNRCFLTLLFAIAECVTIVGNEYTWAMGFEFNIGKLYANSLLASLNTRQYVPPISGVWFRARSSRQNCPLWEHPEPFGGQRDPNGWEKASPCA
ncbi:hypothetical protein EDD16DRAFT_417618 [Pisolithus croceorrhizus]|nr:hypothetical protein EDD16DRAFT_417618 [Pisolithus croceorrhizus]